MVEGLVLQRYSGSCLAGMLASLIRMDFQTADYWALHLQMETLTGSKMVERSAIGMKI